MNEEFFSTVYKRAAIYIMLKVSSTIKAIT
jgi:hypothetical protein